MPPSRRRITAKWIPAIHLVLPTKPSSRAASACPEARFKGFLQRGFDTQESESAIASLTEALRLAHGTSAVCICAERLIDQGWEKVILFFDPDDGSPVFSRFVKLLPDLWRLRPGLPVTLRLAPGLDGFSRRKEELQAFKVRLKRLGPILSKYSDQDPERIATAWQQLLDEAGDGAELTRPYFRQAALFSPTAEAWLFTRLRSAKAGLADRPFQKHKPSRSAASSRSPQDAPELWIIAFERNLSGLEQAISCCVPDWDAIGYAMPHYLREDVPVERSSKGFLRAKALFLDRLQPLGMRVSALSSHAPES